MLTHKYADKEIRTQAKIKKAGLAISLFQAGIRTGGPDFAPIFGEPTRTTLFALITSNEQLFRNRETTVKGDILLMVSTESIDGDSAPAVGETVKIERSSDFPNVTTGEYLIVEVKLLAPAGVPIFYVLGITGQQS